MPLQEVQGFPEDGGAQRGRVVNESIRELASILEARMNFKIIRT